MAIPDFQSITLPALRLHSDGGVKKIQATREALAVEFRLTPDERKALLPSGKQATFNNRVAWAVVYLKQAGLLESPARGTYRITDAGRKVLLNPPAKVNLAFLSQFEGIQAFRAGTRASGVEGTVVSRRSDEAVETPEETIDEAYDVMRNALAADVLERTRECSPGFFEHLVLEVLSKMGYGGRAEGAIEVTGGSGDGGIDGIIKEDELGLDIICVQAKRWDGTVGRPVVQAFAGSMEAVRARKGVIITTSRFSPDAMDYVSRVERKIVLIDGQRLARLMVDHGVGVSDSRIVVLKKIDSDFFDESAA